MLCWYRLTKVKTIVSLNIEIIPSRNTLHFVYDRDCVIPLFALSDSAVSLIRGSVYSVVEYKQPMAVNLFDAFDVSMLTNEIKK